MNPMKKLISVLCLISLATPVFGQQGRYRLGRFSLITPLQIAGTQDSNFLIERGDPLQRLFMLSLPPSVLLGAPQAGPQRVSDQTLMLTMPTLAFQNGSRRHEITATYMPEFELFRTYHDQNAWNHKAMADFTYFPSRKTRFIIGDEYRGSQDPSRIMQNPFLLLPRSSFRQNAIRTTFEVEASPVTFFGFDYDNTITTFGQTDPFQTRILDTIAHGVSFTARRLVTRKQRISGTYSFFKLKPINNARPNDDAVDTRRELEHPIQAAKLQYRYSFSASSALELGGGVSVMDNGTNYLMRIGGYRRLGEFWLGGEYSRELSVSAGPTGLPNGLGAASFYDLVSFRMRGQPARNIAVQTEIGGTLNASRRVVSGGRSLLARARFDYRLTDRTVTFVSVESYRQPLNDYVRAPLSRNRFTVGMEFSLASEAARRTDPRNQDEQYVALTEHARRRRPPE